MSFKKINFLFIALLITALSACEKDDSTTTNNTSVSKEGTFKGALTYKSTLIDTSFADIEIAITKISDNKYNAASTDGSIDFDVIDNNGTLSVSDEFKATYTAFTGTLSSTAFTFQTTVNDPVGSYQIGYVGAKVNTPTPTNSEAYFIIDDSTITCNPAITSCGLSTGVLGNFYFSLLDANSSSGGSLTIRTDTIPTPGVYNVVDYEEYYSETLAPNECAVFASKNMFSGGSYSTGLSGTVTITSVNGKLAFDLSNVSVADFNGNVFKTISRAKGVCK